ncbi:LysR substrate-binding domain-containing protein [Sphingobacterium sp. HJSM2_6]|uniref:LysR substrate-binding domain-containing protein n=1 Tax=Sphingobacterium sp. HJSM2_6 TaxID=3366264 RepID=UPI003BE05C13
MNYQIELRHLQYFAVLAEELHFRKAAERLFISQPGLSRQIKELEQYYQTALLIRDNRNVKLTDAGVFLKKNLEQLFLDLAIIKNQIGKIDSGLIKTLQLGFIGSAVQVILPELLVTLKKEQPQLEISLNELPNERQLEMLMRNELDFGFVRTKNCPQPLKSIPIMTDPFALVVPKGFRNKLNKPVDLRDFKQESFILFSKDYSNSYYELVMSIFEDHGFEPHVSLKTVNALSIFNLVSQGLGVAIVPTSLKKGYYTHVDFIELNHIPQRTTLYLIWNSDNLNPAVPFVLNTIKKIKSATP